MKSRRLPLLIATLALAGSLAVLTFRSPSRTASIILPTSRAPVVCAPEHESPAGRKTGESAARRLPAIAPRAAVTAQPPEPAPASTRAAYPGQDELPASWHDFGRARTKITVAPYPDLPLTFERTAVKDEGRYVTWFGTVREIPGSSLVAVATPGGGFHSVMIIPGSSQFAFDTDADGETTVSESQPGEEGCAIGGLMPDRTTAQAPTTSALFKAQYTGTLASYTVGSNYTGSPSEVAFGSFALEGDALQVGVLFLYDAGTLAAAGSADTIDGRSKAYIESGNVVLANSAVGAFRWKYLGAKQAPAYTRPDAGANLDFDLTAITAGGTIGDWVSGQAYQTGAAQVLLWLDKSAKGAIYSGVANTGGKAIAVNSTGRARAVARWDASYKTTIHELSHNFGCQHDRANAGAGGTGLDAKDGDGFYCYESLWSTSRTEVINSNTGETRVVTYIAGTIMSYGSSLIPYFSNPNISVRVTSALADYSGTNIDVDWGVLPLGLPTTDAKAAYNVKVLNDGAATIAALGAAIVAPAITTQPQNVSATSGANFSLSVTATGGGLSYQWSKDGASINGATASSYAKSSATSADAGNYTVVATNLAGTVTSNTAIVSVTAAPPPPTGGGAGGGGGALSVWFLCTLAMLAALRRSRAKTSAIALISFLGISISGSASTKTTTSYTDQSVTIANSSYDIAFSMFWIGDDASYLFGSASIELRNGSGSLLGDVSGSYGPFDGISVVGSLGTVDYDASPGQSLTGVWHLTGLSPGNYSVRSWRIIMWDTSSPASKTTARATFTGGSSPIPPPPPVIAVSFDPGPLSFTYNGGWQGPNANPSPPEAGYTTSDLSSQINAGTFRVQYDGNAPYSGTYATYWTINPASVGFYLTQSSFTYNGGYQAPGIGVSGDANGLSYGTGGTTGAVNAGSYAMNVYTTDGNHTGSSNLSWTINPASQGSVSISPGSASITTGQSITFSAAGGSTGNYSWGGSASGSGATKLVTFNSTGTYSVTVQDTGNGNWYASNVATATITVTQANQSPTIAWYDIPTSFYYGGTEYARASAADADGNLTRIVVEYSTNGGAWQAYTDTSFGATGSSVSPATAFAVGIKPGNYYTFRAQAYDSAGAATGWLYSGNYYPTNRAPTASFSLSSERTLGQTITVTMTVNDADANYSYSNLWVATPNRGWLTIRADNSVVVSGALTPANTSAATAGTHARTFGFTATDGAGSYTFALAAVDASGARTDAPNQPITITKATQSTAVTSAGGTALYGDSFTATATGGNGSGSYVFELVAGGSASAGALSSTGVITASSVGTVLFRVYRAGDTTYNNSAYSPTYTVTFNARPLVVTLTGSKTYNGTTAPAGAAASITSGTLGGGDSIGYSFTNTSSANVGSYPGLQTVSITAGASDRSSNYTVTKSGSYAITAASVTFTVSPTSFNYDGSAHGPTITPSITYSTSGTASATAVGSYTVSVTAYGNYSGAAGPVAWNIVQVTYTLTTSASGPGSVTPGGTYNAGNGVTITATPQPTGRFIGWTGDASGLSNPLLVTMDGNKTITGLFAAKIAQTISFNPPATVRLNGDGSGSLVLSATSTSGLPVRFTLVGGPASLSGATLNFTGAGAVTVQADQDGDATYAAAPAVVRSITTFLAARFKQSEQPDELGDKQKPGSNMVRDRP